MRHPEGSYSPPKKEHMAHLCEGCIIYGDCGGLFYQPLVINDALAIITSEKTLLWVEDSKGILCKFTYKGESHTAIIKPHIHVYEKAEGKLLQVVNDFKKRVLDSKKINLDIKDVKKWLTSTAKTCESYLGELEKFRKQASSGNNAPCLFFIEQTMLEKIAITSWVEEEGKKKKEEDLLKSIMNGWKKSNKIVNFLTNIVDALKEAATLNNPATVRILMRALAGIDAEKEIITNLAAVCMKSNSFDCLKLICEEFQGSLQFETRPRILLDSIQVKNIPATELLISTMANTKRFFVCDDCFQEVIKNDMIKFAKQLINHGWHKPTEADYQLSKKLDGNIFAYLSARREFSLLGFDDENCLDLNDEGWDTDGDEEDHVW